MKKLLRKTTMVITFLVIVNFQVIGQVKKTESYLRLGYENGNLFEKSFFMEDSLLTTVKSHGIDFTSYSFDNDSSVGFYVADSFLLLSSVAISSSGNSVELNLEGLDLALQVQMALGPGFRSKLTEDLEMMSGVGISVTQVSMIGNGSYQVYGFGLAGDVALNVNLANKWFFSFGAKLGADFFQIDAIYGESSSGLSTLKFNPFISIGFNHTIAYSSF